MTDQSTQHRHRRKSLSFHHPFPFHTDLFLFLFSFSLPRQVHQSYVFAGQLSFEKLEDSWYELGHVWPIIFARTRRDEDSPSGLSFYVPTRKRLEEIRREAAATSDPQKKPFYCLDNGSQLFSDYFPGLREEEEGDSVSDRKTVFTTLAPKSDAFDKIAKANSPRVFEDYLTGEFPHIAIQVARFADVTVITRSNSHIYGDGFTMAAVLNAWQAILDGKGPPPPMQDVGYDPFAHLGPPPEPLIPWHVTEPRRVPPPPLGWRILNLKDKVQLIARMLYDLKVSRPESSLQQRYIFLPKEVTDRLQAEAKADLAVAAAMAGKDGETAGEVRIGKSDVLYAWLLKTAHATFPASTMVTPLSIINLKGRPPPGIKLPRHSFFCSALPVPLQSISAGELTDMPLGQLALYVRKSHQVYLDPTVQLDCIRFHLHHALWKRPSGQIPFFCPPHHRWFGLSDLRALRYFQLDFKGAQPSTSSSSSSSSSLNEVGRLIAQHVDMTCAMSKRDRFLCLGDSDKGTWFTGSLSKDQWEDPRGFGKYTLRT